MKLKQITPLELLQLSKNEQTILNLLNSGSSTPVLLAKKCSIPRPTIYITLVRLAKRGLIIKKKSDKKIYWSKNLENVIEKYIFLLRSFLLKNKTTDTEKILITDSSQVIVHRGQKALLKLFTDMVEGHKGEKMIALQGNMSAEEWSKIFPVKDINVINKKIIQNKLITELITSKEWFERQTKLLGVDWAKNFEGRTMRMQNIDDKYLNYSAQIFIFKNKVLIDSMKDEVFIEIRNPEIAKLLISLAHFVQDHSEVSDANELLRGIIRQNSKQKHAISRS